MPKVSKTTKPVKTTKATKAEKATKKVTSPKKVVAKKAVPEKVVAKKEKVTTASTANKEMKSQSELVKKYRGNAKDTGSVSVQIALLTDRITLLAKHLTKHIHDFDSKRGLLILVGKRRRLLNYLRKNNEKVYEKLVKDLKLKK